MPISLYEGNEKHAEVKRTTELDTQNSPRNEVNYQAIGKEIGDLVHHVPVPHTDDTNADE